MGEGAGDSYRQEKQEAPLHLLQPPAPTPQRGKKKAGNLEHGRNLTPQQMRSRGFLPQHVQIPLSNRDRWECVIKGNQVAGLESTLFAYPEPEKIASTERTPGQLLLGEGVGRRQWVVSSGALPNATFMVRVRQEHMGLGSRVFPLPLSFLWESPPPKKKKTGALSPPPLSPHCYISVCAFVLTKLQCTCVCMRVCVACRTHTFHMCAFHTPCAQTTVPRSASKPARTSVLCAGERLWLWRVLLEVPPEVSPSLPGQMSYSPPFYILSSTENRTEHPLSKCHPSPSPLAVFRFNTQSLWHFSLPPLIFRFHP